VQVFRTLTTWERFVFPAVMKEQMWDYAMHVAYNAEEDNENMRLYRELVQT
jgi:DNA-binding SARP family transcriptional activator